MKKLMGLVVTLAMLGPGTCLAQNLTARQILAKVSETYRGLKSFRFVEIHESRAPASHRTNPLPGPFGIIPARYKTDLTVSAPGKIRLEVNSGGPKILLVSDGSKTTAYIAGLSEYKYEYEQLAAVPLLQELWRQPISLVTDDLYRHRNLSQKAGRAKLRGVETLSFEGRRARCYVLDVPAHVGARRIWVDEQRFIVLQDEWASNPSGRNWLKPNDTVFLDSGVWISRLTKANLGPISANAFQFVIPKGAHRVESFRPPWGLEFRAAEMRVGALTGSETENPVQQGYVSLYATDPVLLQAKVHALLGTKAHDFTLASLGGGNIRLKSLRGKIVVLDFFASWCEPCQEELAAVQKLHDELASKGVVFLGIDDEPQGTVEGFAKAHSYTFSMLLDPKGAVTGLYGVRLAPTTVVINRKGKITSHFIGAGGEKPLLRALKKAGLKLPAKSARK